MRRALNENSVVQVAVLGVLALVVAFFLFTRVLGEDSAEEPAVQSGVGASPAVESGAEGTLPTPSEPAPATGSPPAPAPSTGASPAPAGPPAAAVDGAFSAGPGLPRAVVSAYDDGKTVVLLISKKKGLDDRAMKRSIARLRERGSVALFVVPAKKVSRYARITEGVNVDRVPALLVIRPRKLNDGIPEATVSYGFRGPESAEQAVEDAVFDGKSATYDP